MAAPTASEYLVRLKLFIEDNFCSYSITTRFALLCTDPINMIDFQWTKDDLVNIDKIPKSWKRSAVSYKNLPEFLLAPLARSKIVCDSKVLGILYELFETDKDPIEKKEIVAFANYYSVDIGTYLKKNELVKCLDRPVITGLLGHSYFQRFGRQITQDIINFVVQYSLEQVN